MMGGGLVRFFFRLSVTGLALSTFFFVQIGRRTPYEHLVAIFSTAPAKEAAQDLRGAGTELTARLVEEGHRLTHAAIDAGTNRRLP